MVHKKASAYGYLIIAILIILFLLFQFLFVNSYGSLEGTRIGNVVSIENRGGMFPATIVQFNSNTQEEFCVNDWDLMKSLKAASDKEYTVKIYYYRPTITFVWKCNGGSAIIRDIDYVRG
jgi:hypothetical protein